MIPIEKINKTKTAKTQKGFKKWDSQKSFTKMRLTKIIHKNDTQNISTKMRPTKMRLNKVLIQKHDPQKWDAQKIHKNNIQNISTKIIVAKNPQK